MKRRMKRRGPPLLPRRGIALAAAAATLWTVGKTADLPAARRALLGSGKVVSGLLELEMGKNAPEEGLNPWAELVVDQSPVLAGEKEAVSVWQRELIEEAADSAEEPEPTPKADPIDAGTAETDPADRSEPAADSGAGKPEGSEKTEQKTGEKQISPIQAADLSKIGPGSIQVENHTERQKPQVKKYWKKAPALTLAPAKDGPQILITHTHTTEAYTMADGDDYEESDQSRTTDEHYNVIRVGEEMKSVFEEMGLSVVHDKTTYDYPGYNGSYARSMKGVQKYLEKYPTIQVVLDVHRDALIDSKGTVYSKTTTIDGEETAQVMLVVGTDDGGLTHPNWRNNYTLALKIQGAMLAEDATLPRPIDLRSQRFNEHLTPGSLLVEVGTSGNTLRQALAGARRFARSSGSVYLTCVKKK